MTETNKKKSFKSVIFPILFTILAIHPFIELDYLLADFLPIRPTTIIDFVILPIAVLVVFVLFEKDKRRS